MAAAATHKAGCAGQGRSDVAAAELSGSCRSRPPSVADPAAAAAAGSGSSGCGEPFVLAAGRLQECALGACLASQEELWAALHHCQGAAAQLDQARQDLQRWSTADTVWLFKVAGHREWQGPALLSTIEQHYPHGVCQQGRLVQLLTADPVSRQSPVQMTLLEALAHFGLPDLATLQQAEDAAQQHLGRQRQVLGSALSKVRAYMRQLAMASAALAMAVIQCSTWTWLNCPPELPPFEDLTDCWLLLEGNAGSQAAPVSVDSLRRKVFGNSLNPLNLVRHVDEKTRLVMFQGCGEEDLPLPSEESGIEGDDDDVLSEEMVTEEPDAVGLADVELHQQSLSVMQAEVFAGALEVICASPGQQQRQVSRAAPSQSQQLQQEERDLDADQQQSIGKPVRARRRRSAGADISLALAELDPETQAAVKEALYGIRSRRTAAEPAGGQPPAHEQQQSQQQPRGKRAKCLLQDVDGPAQANHNQQQQPSQPIRSRSATPADSQCSDVPSQQSQLTATGQLQALAELEDVDDDTQPRLLGASRKKPGKKAAAVLGSSWMGGCGRSMDFAEMRRAAGSSKLQGFSSGLHKVLLRKQQLQTAASALEGLPVENGYLLPVPYSLPSCLLTGEGPSGAAGTVRPLAASQSCSTEAGSASAGRGGAGRRGQRSQIRELVRGDVGLSEAAKWKNLVARSKQVVFHRSGVHGWGLFAGEDIAADEFVIEYVGELIRPVLSDGREKMYESRGQDSSYLFRVDNEWVADATVRGGRARFINHSCDPNCYTKIFTIDGTRKIGIYAKKAVAPGEELAYDYKFDYEEDARRVPCACGAKNCRGFMN
eukprot:gene4530-4782_t